MKKIKNTLLRDSMEININRLILVLPENSKVVAVENIYLLIPVRPDSENQKIKGISINNPLKQPLFKEAELVHMIRRISPGVTVVPLPKTVIRTAEKF